VKTYTHFWISGLKSFFVFENTHFWANYFFWRAYLLPPDIIPVKGPDHHHRFDNVSKTSRFTVAWCLRYGHGPKEGRCQKPWPTNIQYRH